MPRPEPGEADLAQEHSLHPCAVQGPRSSPAKAEVCLVSLIKKGQTGFLAVASFQARCDSPHHLGWLFSKPFPPGRTRAQTSVLQRSIPELFMSTQWGPDAFALSWR